MNDTRYRLSASVLAVCLVLAGCGVGAGADLGAVSETTSSELKTSGVQINCGGPAVTPFVADKSFTASANSRTINHPEVPIDRSKVTNAAPAAVYQTARIGDFVYTISGYAPGAASTIRLHSPKRTSRPSTSGPSTLRSTERWS